MLTGVLKWCHGKTIKPKEKQMKTQIDTSDKATARPLADVQAVLNNAASMLDKGLQSSDMANACWEKARVITAFQREHAALCAVAEAAKALYNKVNSVGDFGQGCDEYLAFDEGTLKPKLESFSEALAALAAIRSGNLEPKETDYRKAIRTGKLPAVWPPISMSHEDLEHFRKQS
jgi:hypothetical protein